MTGKKGVPRKNGKNPFPGVDRAGKKGTANRKKKLAYRLERRHNQTNPSQVTKRETRGRSRAKSEEETRLVRRGRRP